MLEMKQDMDAPIILNFSTKIGERNETISATREYPIKRLTCRLIAVNTLNNKYTQAPNPPPISSNINSLR